MVRRTASLLFRLLFVVVLGIPGALFPTPSAVAGAQGTSDQLVKVLSSDAGGLLVELNLPNFQTDAGQSDAGTCLSIRLTGWGQLGESGQPDVPFLGEMIGLPPLGTARLTVVESSPEVVVNDFNLCPVATLAPILDPSVIPPTYNERFTPDVQAYLDPAFQPSEWASLGTPSFIRSQRVAQLRLQPFEYQASAHRLRYITHLVVRVQFDTPLSPTGSWIDEGPYEAILKNTLLNYAAASSWRVSQVQPATDLSQAANPNPAVQLAVSKDSLYRVSYSDLQAKGVPVDSLDPSTFRLLNHNVETAILVRTQVDGVFSSGDDILFYGQKNTTKYTDANIYWLTWGGATPGLRVDSIVGTPGTGSPFTAGITTTHAEQNITYLTSDPSGPDQDHWYWGAINTQVVTSKDFTFNLTHVSTTAPPTQTAVVRGLLRSYVAVAQHHTKIYLNGVLIKDDIWPAQDEYTFEVSVPHSLLLEGTNTITVECPLDATFTEDYLFINWFEVDYLQDYTADGGVARFNGEEAGLQTYQVSGFSGAAAEIWNVTQPLNPQRILNPVFEASGAGYTLVFRQDSTGAQTYLAVEPGSLLSPDSITPYQPAGLRSTANGADYIIITHPNFLGAVQPLAAYHAAQGLRVRVVNVQDIYNEFSAGIFDPNAIHDFLAYAYNNWVRPAPSFVLLVGDGNYDFKNYLGTNEINYIPPYLADVDPWMGEAPADNLYVAFDPANDLPSMALGRLPVKTVSEANTIVQKILAYPQTTSGAWSKKVMLVADASDDAGNFSADSDAFGSQLPSRFMVDKIYLPQGLTASSPILAAARQNILNGLNDGRLIVHYTGHSAIFFWSTLNLFQNTKISSLTNLSKLPFVLSMTCYLGYYVIPSPTGHDYSSFDELLVRASNGGAIATWSPTGEGLSSEHALLDAGFTQAAFNNHLSQIGLSTNQAKYYLYANSVDDHELIDTYLLLGDPALSLPLFEVFMPSIQR